MGRHLNCGVVVTMIAVMNIGNWRFNDQRRAITAEMASRLCLANGSRVHYG